MQIIHTDIPEVLIIKPKVFLDNRGCFFESWNARRFKETVANFDFVQDNHSISQKGTLRGMHYQTKNNQGKLVRVTKGEVFDVALDMREESPTLGKWVSTILSADNKEMLWIPPGFAHGFYVLSEFAELQYKCTDYYNPEHEVSVYWADNDINIDWPIDESVDVQLSNKDISGISFWIAPKLRQQNDTQQATKFSDYY